MKILFMGTPDFAVTALNALYEKYGENVIGVITRVDTPKNRGHIMTPPPVKTAAEALNIPVFQPQDLKKENFEQTLLSLSPDVIVVAAYGKILPEYVLNFPKYGCINIHASALPEYRGAAPIARAIMDGKTELGVTIMYMEKGLDTGDMLALKTLKFENGENKGEIEASLASLGAEMITEELSKIENGSPSPRIKQDDSRSSYAMKIEKEDCRIDFSAGAEKNVCLIRALSPAPCAFAMLKGKSVKITRAYEGEETSCENNGKVISVSPKGEGKIAVASGGKTLFIERLIPEGKKEMSAGDFVRGRGIAPGDKFE
ncbi:MAG: methionyl-tRNA formyltransferase [Eubacteriales bacterium]